MAQVTSGVRQILGHPRVYDLLQHLLMPDARTAWWVEHALQVKPGDRVLDIGCGTGDILRFMPGVHYHGFDLSPVYIADAERRFGSRGSFACARVDEASVARLAKFDVVLARGVLHHLDDAEAEALFRLARAALRPGGRLVTLDACFASGQSPFARFLISRDRGQNVRDELGYRALAARVFPDVRSEVRHDLMRVPYTHCTLEARA